MMGTLLRKELRSLRPFLGLVLFVEALSAVDELTTRQPDLRPLAVTIGEDIASASESRYLMFILSLALAAGLLVREHDEGTLEFLDSLPLSRSRVLGK